MKCITGLNRVEQIHHSLEHELILAAVSLDHSNRQQIGAILTHPLDWSLIFKSALQQGVFPLVCKNVFPIAGELIPRDDIEYLKAQLQVRTQNSLRLTWKLIECVELLAKNGIECLIFKGPVLALQAYGDLTLRQFSDLDILIHEGDFSIVYDLVVSYGYVPMIYLSSTQKKYLVRSNNHFPFSRQGDVLEVHWKIVSQENIPLLTPERLWCDTAIIQMSDQSLRTLSHKNTILYLCFHGAKHGWKQLKWIVDVSYMCQSCPDNFWPPLLELAEQYGIIRQVSLGLLLAEDLVGAVLPQDVHNQIITYSQVNQLKSQIMSRLFTENRRSTLTENYIFYSKTREHWQDRLHYLINLIMMPEMADWLNIPLPESLYFLYYVVRPLRLISHAIKAAVTLQ